jgi:hypothetical protein
MHMLWVNLLWVTVISTAFTSRLRFSRGIVLPCAATE